MVMFLGEAEFTREIPSDHIPIQHGERSLGGSPESLHESVPDDGFPGTGEPRKENGEAWKGLGLEDGEAWRPRGEASLEGMVQGRMG